ncbi:PQQ-dependent sugar dehydrogenase [Thermocrispum agreste]|uniref:PQQ-dependent sugar dehydrogenase n=1 Tax=Thermocrispum agreste TaxID=37925 RepID=UPI00048EDFF6|nr:PQQ-dependent sugar dehydrogenase [Thermocrispum agreste]
MRVLAAIAASGLLLSGCARFDDSAADADFQPAPQLTPQRPPQPELPEAPGSPEIPQGQGGRGTGQRDGEIPPPEGCTDHDPAVIGTCMDTLVAVAALPPVHGQPAALAAERDTGRVLRVVKGRKPAPFATLTVAAEGDGGLTGLALSPSYQEDGLVFAYITTSTDNRVVRFAAGQKPRPILTGIPKGARGNRGALAVDASGALLVATGDAGDPKAARNPDSLAGKVLRIDTSGKPAAGNPRTGSRVIASGLHTPGGVCASGDGSQVWVTDRAPEADAIHLVDPGKPLGTPVWRWKDKPGVAGCAVATEGVVVAMSTDPGLHGLEIDANGTATGKPSVTFDGDSGYGRLSGLDVYTAGLAVAGTVNKDGGKPVSSDDRVVLLPLNPSGGNDKD